MSTMSATLHIFNPFHDEALAAASPYYYPSKIARQLSADWALLPLMWAEEGDVIYCPDEAGEVAEMCADLADERGVELVKKKDMKPAFWERIFRIEPWGWDALVKHQLGRWGAPACLLPTDEKLFEIRRLSARQTTTVALPELVERLSAKGIAVMGMSHIAREMDEVEQLLNEWGRIVVKSLWSCSGRGVFTIEGQPTASDMGRIRKLLRTQGGVEVEPWYDGVMDMALELDAKADGGVVYRGLSLFLTSPNGGYKANIVARQDALKSRLFEKFPFIEKHFPTLCSACEEVLSKVVEKTYEGPLGVDMMVVKNEQGILLLHPCIEVNVRRTMGYVACVMGERGIKAWPVNFPFSEM